MTDYDAGVIDGLREAARIALDMRGAPHQDRAKDRHQRRMATRIFQQINDAIVGHGGQQIAEERE